jgi:hypothetical protein
MTFQSTLDSDSIRNPELIELAISEIGDKLIWKPYISREGDKIKSLPMGIPRPKVQTIIRRTKAKSIQIPTYSNVGDAHYAPEGQALPINYMQRDVIDINIDNPMGIRCARTEETGWFDPRDSESMHHQIKEMYYSLFKAFEQNMFAVLMNHSVLTTSSNPATQIVTSDNLRSFEKQLWTGNYDESQNLHMITNEHIYGDLANENGTFQLQGNAGVELMQSQYIQQRIAGFNIHRSRFTGSNATKAISYIFPDDILLACIVIEPQIKKWKDDEKGLVNMQIKSTWGVGSVSNVFNKNFILRHESKPENK